MKCARITSNGNYRGGIYDGRIVKVNALDYEYDTVDIELIPETLETHSDNKKSA